MSDGITVLYTVYAGFAGLTALVRADRIVSDDVLPAGQLPALQLEMVSGFDRNILNNSPNEHVHQRIRTRIHATDAVERSAVRRQVRKAIKANRFPTVAGLDRVVVDKVGEGPDGLAPESNVRIGLVDCMISYVETD